MKAACLLTDSAYNLTVFDRGGKGKEGPDLGFIELGEGADGVGTGGAGSVGRGASVGSSSDWILPPSFDLASDSRFVLNVVGVWRFWSTSFGGRSENSVRSGTFSRETGVPRKKQFWAEKSVHISAKMVSILVE